MYKLSKTSRLKLIGKIHALKNQVNLDDDVYRLILNKTTGKHSCKDMNTKELLQVIEEFNKTWFIDNTPKYNTYKTKSKFIFVNTACPKLKKIFKLWQELAETEELENSKNEALNAFLENKFKTNYQTLNTTFYIHNSTKDNIIEALKDWLKRAKNNNK